MSDTIKPPEMISRITKSVWVVLRRINGGPNWEFEGGAITGYDTPAEATAWRDQRAAANPQRVYGVFGLVSQISHVPVRMLELTQRED